MIDGLPNWIEILFLISSVAAIILCHYSNGKSRRLTLILILWSIIQSTLAYNGFYQYTSSIPPRFALVLIPAILFIVYGLLPKQRDWFLKRRNIRISTFLHTVRLPVELVLFGLFMHGMVPGLMTFEGKNIDIIMGISAPIVGLLFISNNLSKKWLMIWNIIGLGLVLFILTLGVLSAELPFQQLAFDQPNRGINYFPFVLLPATVVPIVIWTHIIDIIKLSKEIKGV